MISLNSLNMRSILRSFVTSRFRWYHVYVDPPNGTNLPLTLFLPDCNSVGAWPVSPVPVISPNTNNINLQPAVAPPALKVDMDDDENVTSRIKQRL